MPNLIIRFCFTLHLPNLTHVQYFDITEYSYLINLHLYRMVISFINNIEQLIIKLMPVNHRRGSMWLLLGCLLAIVAMGQQTGACKFGEYWSSATFTCLECLSTCSKCVDLVNKCTQCSYGLNLNIKSGICESCKVGELNCTNSNAIQCQPHYSLVYNKCFPVCSDTHCDSCDTIFPRSCKACSQGYVLSPNKTCNPKARMLQSMPATDTSGGATIGQIVNSTANQISAESAQLLKNITGIDIATPINLNTGSLNLSTNSSTLFASSLNQMGIAAGGSTATPTAASQTNTVSGTSQTSSQPASPINNFALNSFSLPSTTFDSSFGNMDSSSSSFSSPMFSNNNGPTATSTTTFTSTPSSGTTTINPGIASTSTPTTITTSSTSTSTPITNNPIVVTPAPTTATSTITTNTVAVTPSIIVPSPTDRISTASTTITTAPSTIVNNGETTTQTANAVVNTNTISTPTATTTITTTTVPTSGTVVAPSTSTITNPSTGSFTVVNPNANTITTTTTSATTGSTGTTTTGGTGTGATGTTGIGGAGTGTATIGATTTVSTTTIPSTTTTGTGTTTNAGSSSSVIIVNGTTPQFALTDSNCRIGEYLFNGQCNLCSSRCATCINSAEQCLECADGWTKAGWKCVKNQTVPFKLNLGSPQSLQSPFTTPSVSSFLSGGLESLKYDIIKNILPAEYSGAASSIMTLGSLLFNSDNKSFSLSGLIDGAKGMGLSSLKNFIADRLKSATKLGPFSLLGYDLGSPAWASSGMYPTNNSSPISSNTNTNYNTNNVRDGPNLAAILIPAILGGLLLLGCLGLIACYCCKLCCFKKDQQHRQTVHQYQNAGVIDSDRRFAPMPISKIYQPGEQVESAPQIVSYNNVATSPQTVTYKNVQYKTSVESPGSNTALYGEHKYNQENNVHNIEYEIDDGDDGQRASSAKKAVYNSAQIGDEVVNYVNEERLHENQYRNKF